MTESAVKNNWLIEVEKVIRDEFGSALWVRLRYFKFEQISGESGKNLKHDLVFAPGKDGWPFVLHRLTENFVPQKRYHRMAVRAQAIFSENR